MQEKIEMKNTGKEFELEIKALFQLLGYEVQHNIEISGQQVDLFLTYKIPGGKIINRIIVECKYRSSGNIGNEIVNEFYGFCHKAFSKGVADFGMIVTNQDFTTTAKSAALNSKIQLVTLDELTSNLVNFDKYLKHLIFQYENYDKVISNNQTFMIDIMERSDLYKYYVSSSCYEKSLRHSTIDDPIKIESAVENFLIDPEKNYLAILGDFGIGKSSFLLKLTYELAKKCLTNKYKYPIPIFVSLKDYKQINNIQSLLKDLLVTKYDLNFKNFNLLFKLIEARKVLLIFDGFDEMATTGSKRETIENLKILCGIKSKNIKIILAARTHYFESVLHEERLLSDETNSKYGVKINWKKDFQKVYIKEFGKNEIIAYLQKHSTNYNELWKKINDTYNLADLAKRPLLLQMIAVTMDKILKSDKINIVELYKFYTDIWITREDWNSSITEDGKRIFMEELALKINRSSDATINYRLLPVPIKSHFSDQIDDREQLTALVTEIRTCSFLNRDDNGNYKFIHKSFMEYFLSCYLKRKIEGGHKIPVNSSVETGMFLRHQELPEDRLADYQYYLFNISGWLDTNIREEDYLTETLIKVVANIKIVQGKELAKAITYLWRRNETSIVPSLFKTIEVSDYNYAKDMALTGIFRMGTTSEIEQAKELIEKIGNPRHLIEHWNYLKQST